MQSFIKTYDANENDLLHVAIKKSGNIYNMNSKQLKKFSNHLNFSNFLF